MLCDNGTNMRRRKKDKTKDKVPASSAEHDTLDFSGRGGSSGSKSSKDADASNNGVTVTVSPPQQRKRSLLGSLGSMRDLVEQVRRRGCCRARCVRLVRFVAPTLPLQSSSHALV